MKKLSRVRNIHIDTIESIGALICIVVFALFLAPVGISASSLTIDCYWDAVFNLISGTLVTIAGSGVLLWLGLENTWQLTKGKQKMVEELKETRKRMVNGAEVHEMTCNILKKMIIAWTTLIIGFVVSLLQILETFDSLRSTPSDGGFCSNKMKTLSVFLMSYDIVLFIVAILLTVFYTMQYYLIELVGQSSREDQPTNIDSVEAQPDKAELEGLIATTAKTQTEHIPMQ